ncbi:MAG: response regulator transcription factor [Ignavibacteria bacterium]|nr:response regulator transcription factor [Ignavibacteria bacterium]
MKRIRLIVIEDNRLLRDGICAMLKKEADFTVVAAFDDSDFDPEKLKELKPNVVLLDLSLTEKDSLDLVNLLRNDHKDVKVIVMDLLPMREDILQFVEAGVSGFIMKDDTISEFLKTIRAVNAGEKILPPTATGSLFSQIMEYGVKELGPQKLIQSVRMTNREKEIVQLIAEGLANKEIAFKLNLSIYTVKSHVHNILDKMALNTRVQIAIHANAAE